MQIRRIRTLLPFPLAAAFALLPVAAANFCSPQASAQTAPATPSLPTGDAAQTAPATPSLPTGDAAQTAPATPSLPASAAALLTIDTNGAGKPLSPLLYGLMIEDINYSIDGGLYAELIRNRAFKDNPNAPEHWSLTPSGRPGKIRLDTTKIRLDTTQPIPGTALTACLRLDVSPQDGGPSGGVANEGCWGIPIRPNTRYRASFYAKSNRDVHSLLTVALQSKDGRITPASTDIHGLSPQWKQYTVTLTTGKVAPSTQNRFVIEAYSPGTVWFNQVSLFPSTWNKRPNGTRKDLMQILADMKPAFLMQILADMKPAFLMQILADMKPAFLRLPGGNYLEGNTIAERFNWRETRGDISQRPGHQDPWGYRSDDGFGLLEYLEWCEDLRMEPVLAVFAGYARRGEHIPAGPRLQPFVQEALDEIEYVIGSADTPMGALRVKDGHSVPFPLTYVEIGNEDWFDKSGSYEGRFAQFYDAIKAKYPRLQLIAATPVKTRTPDVLDEHFYRTAQAMAKDAHHYDNYNRSGPKIFVGEWASQDIDRPWIAPNTKGPTPTMNSALGDAAWMTGMERNADMVLLSSYAPLFVNVNPGARQWAINLIGYDALTSYGSPAYYAQKIFSVYHGDAVLNAEMTGGSDLHYVVSRANKSGAMYIKVVNMSGAAQSAQIVLKGAKSVGARGTAVTLAANSPADTNTLADPTHVVPVTSAFKPSGTTFRYTFPPYSITALILQAR